MMNKLRNIVKMNKIEKMKKNEIQNRKLKDMKNE